MHTLKSLNPHQLELYRVACMREAHIVQHYHKMPNTAAFIVEQAMNMDTPLSHAINRLRRHCCYHYDQIPEGVELLTNLTSLPWASVYFTPV